MPKFTDALDTKVEDIERPPLLPVGSYNALVSKLPTQDTIADGRFDVVDYMMKITSPLDDVDPDSLKEYGALDNTVIRHRFLFNTEDDQAFAKTEFQHRQFLENALQLETKGKTVKQMMNDSVNAPCVVMIRWRADKNDPEIQYAEIGRATAA